MGAIWVVTGFKGAQKDVKIKKLPMRNWPKTWDFQPHGMDIEESQRRVYVINPVVSKGRIEVFRVATNGADVP